METPTQPFNPCVSCGGKVEPIYQDQAVCNACLEQEAINMEIEWYAMREIKTPCGWHIVDI